MNMVLRQFGKDWNWSPDQTALSVKSAEFPLSDLTAHLPEVAKMDIAGNNRQGLLQHYVRSYIGHATETAGPDDLYSHGHHLDLTIEVQDGASFFLRPDPTLLVTTESVSMNPTGFAGVSNFRAGWNITSKTTY